MSDPQQTPGQPYSQPGQPYSQPAQPQPQPPYSQPGQPYSQPGEPYSQPGQPYAQGAPAPGQPYGSVPGQPYASATPPYAQGASTARPGSLGRTAFLVAAISVAFGLVVQLVTPFFYASIGFGAVTLVSNLVNLVVLAGAAAGLWLGILALRRPAPHLPAAIAVGLAGSTLVGVLTSWIANLFSYVGF
jgi:hypothetical protein